MKSLNSQEPKLNTENELSQSFQNTLSNEMQETQPLKFQNEVKQEQSTQLIQPLYNQQQPKQHQKITQQRFQQQNKNSTKNKPKKTTWGKFILSALLLTPRSIECFFLSFVIHTIVITLLCVLILPARGFFDENLIDVGFISEESYGEEVDEAESGEEYYQNLPDMPQDFEEDLEGEVYDSLETMQENIAEHGDEIIKVHQKRQEIKIQQHKAYRKQLKEKAGDVARALRGRQKLGLIKPRTFYGVKILAKRMIFVLDISGSMNIHEARIQLKNSYNDLQESEFFNIIVFDSNITFWKERLVPATSENKDSADEWIMQINSGGSTNIHDALQTSISIGKQPPTAECIYFLTDGQPTAGPIVNQKMLLEAVQQWNQKKIIINTIGIGPHQDKNFLAQLAEENRGMYSIR
ncbi:MAG: VWA domain-containing protein [Planctomycetes bacterium]|jgi:Mg-chelatase subunit ChlD|nr:VWA domain-containing protein [Planctomycetota bacterium]HPY75351.1 VWA domain-containing protein [Planctomycetota bacterium]HQA99692.1 VWA domain-containing protein [Planctomycetota bacterium]HRU51327.1 VWA domain-containing protein [Planctomycetota bacterium]